MPSSAAAGQFSVLVYTADQPKAAYKGLIITNRTFFVNTSPVAKIEPTGESPRIQNWKTVYSDGNSLKEEKSLCLMLGTELCRISMASHKAKFVFPKKQFPFNYSIETLEATPLRSTGDKPFVLIGQNELQQAKSDLKDHRGDLANLRETANTYSHPFNDPTSRDLKVEMLSICGDYLGIEKFWKEENSSAVHPDQSLDWGTYKIAGHNLKRIDLKTIPQPIQEDAVARLKKVDSDTLDLFQEPDWDHFLLIPKGPDFEIDFGVTTVSAVVHGLVLPISASCAGSFPPEYARLNKEFSKNRPELKKTFFAPAPDQSAVIYADNGQLVFKDLASGKTKTVLNDMKSFRGWQWVSLQSITNQSELLGTQAAAAATKTVH
jgi:hypothetical protein